MKKPEQARKVGMSNMSLDNSSISNIVIDGRNSDADVGIFGIDMKDAHLNNLNIRDEKKEKGIPNKKPEKKSFMKRVVYNPYVIGLILIAIEEITLGTIYKSIIALF